VATGTVANVCPTVNTTYWVDEYLDGCLSSAQVTVTIDFSGTCSRMIAPHPPDLSPVQEAALAKFDLQPNPASDNAEVMYSVPQGVKGELMVTDSYGRILVKKDIDSFESRTYINCTTFKNGLYYVSLLYNGKPMRTIKMAVMK
jgi:hypothetical protein